MVTRRIGGRYRLLERRAIGGMAAVWRGLDERTGRVVAIKLLHPHLASEPDARRRLDREARATQAIEHPSVVAVRDVVLEPDAPAMVMDFVDGPSLAERLAATGPMPEGEALPIALDIAAGLAAAHGRGIVHRDIKPGNILIGPDGRARVGDFGIATHARGADLTALTAEHGVVGTLRYLAPERLVGDPAVPATDVWGVGAVLYEMLAGRPAFDDTGGVLAADRTIPPRPGLAGDATWAILERALAPDPDDRFADGAALLAALEAHPAAPGHAAASAEAETARIPLPPGEAPRIHPDRAPSPRTDRRRAAPIVAAILVGSSALLGAVAVLGLSDGGDGRTGVDRSGAPVPSVVSTVAPTPSPVTATDGDGTGKPDKDRGKGKGNGHGKGKGGD